MLGNNEFELENIRKAMVIEMKRDGMVCSNRTICSLRQYFVLDGKIQLSLSDDVFIQNMKAIYEFNSIGSKDDINSWQYNKNEKYISFRTQKDRDILIKELYSTALVCQYPTYLKIEDNYLLLNGLTFNGHNKESELYLIFEKYDEIDNFIIENIYSLPILDKKENKQYKIQMN